MENKSTFVQSRMNKDIDERLLPKGEYPHAENVRVIDSGDSHIGAMENDLGNLILTDFELTNAVTIGCLADSSNQKLYFFTTSDEKDLVVEYDDLNEITTVLLESSRPDGVLNFNKNYLITGINKIINEDSSKDLLAWTDDFNPPRMINIDRAKTYTVDGFDEEDIAVIKNPPVFAPTLLPTFSNELSQNNLENKFLAFATRYKYLDGEYSAISPFTNYYFIPSVFKVDYYVLENAAMVNRFNSVKINFDTGSKRVTDIEVLVKASNSNTVYIIERFNKQAKEWADETIQNYTFSNSKLYIPLPDGQLSRLYDNVPRLAKSQEVSGNRLMYGNYLENYDIVDIYGQDINIDFSPSLFTRSLDALVLPFEVTTGGSGGTDNYLTVDLTGQELVAGALITFNILLKEQTYEDGSFTSSIPYVLEQNFTDVNELVSSESFIEFVTVTMTNIFEVGYIVSPSGVPSGSVVQNLTGFEIVSSTANTLTISAPYFEYLIDDTPPAVVSYWGFDDVGTIINYSIETTSSSLKSNRSYEAGLIYSDAQGRCCTIQTSENNTLFIPHENAVNQNKMRVSILHNPPYWADRYRIAVKQNKTRYYEVYANVFYEDGAFRWIKLEGTNKDKVSENDNIIIKSDLDGFVNQLKTVRVLEVSDKPKDFLTDNKDSNGEDIIEQAGKYMKIKPPVGVNIDYVEDSFINVEAKASSKGDNFYMYLGAFSNFNETTMLWEDIAIPQGTQITFDLENTKYGSSGGLETLNKTFVAGADYLNIEDWFNTEQTIAALSPFNEPDTRWVRGEVTQTPFGAGFNEDPSGALYLAVRNVLNGNGQHKSRMSGEVNINKTIGLLIFETEPKDSPDEIYYQSSETFMIEDGKHKGNILNQEDSPINEAIVEIDYYNCFAFGNGAESNSYRGAFNTNWVNMDLKPSSTTVEKFKENRRYADLTYSEPYNEGSGINGLNEFNLSRANFKDDIEKKYGSIQKIWSRDTDLLVCQEDKIGYVMYGKAILNNADGTGNVGKITDVLGQYIPYTGEYGISKNPESFAFNAKRVYITDTKRGMPLRLGGDGIFEINYGLSNYFKDTFSEGFYTKKVGAYDPFNDQYNILPDGENINTNVKMDCKQTIKRTNFSGVMNAEIFYGVQVGNAGFSYSTNGVPVRFTLTYDGSTYTTGFVGNPSYNSQLVELGYPVTSGLGAGNLIFPKDSFTPSTAILEIFTPFDDVNLSVAGTCIITPKLEVISVVTNDSGDVGKSLDSRFRWSDSGYLSPYKHFYNPFSITGLTVYDYVSSFEGLGSVPIDGATVTIESFKDFTQDGVMDSLDRLGFLVSDTLYSESDIEDLMAAATFLSKSQTDYDNGDVLVSGSFTFNRLNKRYLYLIWDYNTPPVAVDDFANCETDSEVIIPVLNNDEGNLTGFNVEIVTEPDYGTVIVNPDNTVTYTHDGGTEQEDSFTYRLFDGFEYSNTATVNLTIALSCEGSFTQTGGEGTFSFPISFGLEIGECGISYDAFTIPDEFEIVWNGDIVATTGGLVSGSGTLLFNKTSALPSVATINCYAPNSGTSWTISGICPLTSPTARLANLKARTRGTNPEETFESL